MHISPLKRMYPFYVNQDEFCFAPETKFFFGIICENNHSPVTVNLIINLRSQKDYNILFREPVPAEIWNHANMLNYSSEAKEWFVDNTEIHIRLSTDSRFAMVRFLIEPFQYEDRFINLSKFPESDYHISPRT